MKKITLTTPMGTFETNREEVYLLPHKCADCKNVSSHEISLSELVEQAKESYTMSIFNKNMPACPSCGNALKYADLMFALDLDVVSAACALETSDKKSPKSYCC